MDPHIAQLLARYPLPNDPQGPYGARTYATSSKVRTVTDQFSVRVDHKISDKASLFGRFNLNEVDGPLTNPSQTAIDPSFAVRFFDHQRNAVVSYIRTPSAAFTSESSIGYERSTPNFLSQNQTQPGITFGDGLYEGFNTASGSVMGSYGNLFQVRQNFTWIRGKHSWKAGAEARFNRDSTIFGTNPDGTYTFGGGAAYAPVAIRSQSGLHDIPAGEQLPDSLSGLLTATPFSYTITAAPALFPQGERMDDAAVRRSAYNVFIQDTWKLSGRLTLNYGLRYEVESRIGEAAHLTSGVVFRPDGAHMMVNNRPPYPMSWGGLAPRLAVDWKVDEKTVIRAGAGITTLLREPVAAELRDGRHSVCGGAVQHCLAGLAGSVLERRRARPPAPDVQHRRFRTVPDRPVHGSGFQHRDGPAAFRARPGLAQFGQVAASHLGSGRRAVLPQRLHRQLDGLHRTAHSPT